MDWQETKKLSSSRWLYLKLWSFAGLALGGSSSPLLAATFDIEAATRAYLDQIPAVTRVRSDAYGTCGHWLILFSLLVQILFAWLFMQKGWSARIREQLKTKIHNSFFRTAAFGAVYIIASTHNIP